jgi:hypothetical protein
VTRVFAVPFNGQCLNVGRVEESQGSTRIVRKRSPDFEVEIWASQICGGVGLLVVTYGQFGRDRFEVTKEAVPWLGPAVK